MTDLDILEQQSRKLNVVIALLLRVILKDDDFALKKRKGTADLAIYLKRQGLEYQDIASILDSPVASVRELVNRGTRKKS
jgi:DNA-directed RNA polymerase specialized sigma24 family protein